MTSITADRESLIELYAHRFAAGRTIFEGQPRPAWCPPESNRSRGRGRCLYPVGWPPRPSALVPHQAHHTLNRGFCTRRLHRRHDFPPTVLRRSAGPRHQRRTPRQQVDALSRSSLRQEKCPAGKYEAARPGGCWIGQHTNHCSIPRISCQATNFQNFHCSLKVRVSTDLSLTRVRRDVGCGYEVSWVGQYVLPRKQHSGQPHATIPRPHDIHESVQEVRQNGLDNEAGVAKLARISPPIASAQ